MKHYGLAAALILLVSSAAAHEWTPTYPKLEQSYWSGIMVAEMKLFNKREDIKYYELDVYDKDFNPIRFATIEKITKVNYLQTKRVSIYITEDLKDKIVYICSTSKLLKDDAVSSGVKTRICSKVR